MDPNDDLDIETLLLIAQLGLEDLKDLQGRSKGKSRVGSQPSDTELAIATQVSVLQEYQRFANDYKLARSIDQAIDSDRELLSAMVLLNQAEFDDRQAAVALSRGDAMPVRTPSQRSLRTLASVAIGRDADKSHGKAKEIDSGASTAVAVRSSNLLTQKAEGSDGERVECIACTERYKSALLLRAPCGHRYCNGCLVDLVDSCTRDESLYPVRCCQRSIPEEEILRRLPLKLSGIFRVKAIEFGVPAARRVYCANPQCSAFLGPAGEERADLVCNECFTLVCTECRNPAHPNEMCGENEALQFLVTLASEAGWRRCNGCNAFVELTQGCYHMTCRCRHQFCYLCDQRWKTCQCPQWEESRLLDDANRRVVNQLGVNRAQQEPDQHAERVRQAAERLREDHVCMNHTWVYRHGGGGCEECGDTLRTFLMRCRGCQLLACRRCAQNRL